MWIGKVKESDYAEGFLRIFLRICISKMGSRKTHAKRSRRDKKIAELEVMIAQMRGRVLKKRTAQAGSDSPKKN
jgi:hypothetical protein